MGWQDADMTTDTGERLEVRRAVAAAPATIFGLLCDPVGHVAIDSSGMLMSAEGDRVTAAGDTFVVHMDRDASNACGLGLYDVTVTIETFVPGPDVPWKVLGQIRPQIVQVSAYRLEPIDEGT